MFRTLLYKNPTELTLSLEIRQQPKEWANMYYCLPFPYDNPVMTITCMAVPKIAYVKSLNEITLCLLGEGGATRSTVFKAKDSVELLYVEKHILEALDWLAKYDKQIETQKSVSPIQRKIHSLDERWKAKTLPKTQMKRLSFPTYAGGV